MPGTRKAGCGSVDKENRGILGNILGAFLIKGGALVIQVLLLPAYMDFFSGEQTLGLWYTLLAITGWLTLFDLGLGHSLRNRLPPVLEAGDRRGVRNYLSTTYLTATALVGFLLVFGLFLAETLPWNRIFGIDTETVPSGVLVRSVKTLLVGLLVSLVLRIITSVLYAMHHSWAVSALTLVSNGILLLGVWLLPRRTDGENLLALCRVNAVAVNLPSLVCMVILFSKPLRDCIPAPKYFRRDLVPGILGEGLALLWLNLVFLAVSSANELLITVLSGAEYVVEYQVYHKLFSTAAMAVSLALTPIWSAVTRAGSRGDYLWIRRVYRLFLGGTGLCFLGELLFLPLLGFAVRLWLGENAIPTRPDYGVLFAVLSTLFVLHNVNTSISNGLSWFRLQGIWMTFAMIVFFPLAVLLTRWTGSWIGIVLANILALLPYEILAPIINLRRLKNLPNS